MQKREQETLDAVFKPDNNVLSDIHCLYIYMLYVFNKLN